MRSYALLVTGGLEHVAAASIAELQPGVSIRVMPRAQLPLGHEAGAAGGVGVLLVDSAAVLSPAVYASHCVAAALALIVQCELPEGAPLAAVEEALTPARWAAAWALWHTHDSLEACTALAHDTLEARDTNAEAAGAAPRSFRVASLRGGTHIFGSREAPPFAITLSLSLSCVDAALGGAVVRLQPQWRVELQSPEVCVLCVIVQRSMLMGALLPPFAPRKSDALPLERRAWLCAGLDRPHMRPSRAAALVRLAAPAPGDVLLDPCGGIGLLAIEAAALQRVTAVSLDLDQEATDAAATNAAEAAARGALCLGSTVETRCADALGLGLGAAGGPGAAADGVNLGMDSVDLVVADLPYGLHHARLDVGGLLRALSRVLRPGGRCFLVANAGPGGVAAACAKAAARFPHPGAWRCIGETEHWAGGQRCCALALERVAEIDAPLASDTHTAGDAAGAARAAAARKAEVDVAHLKKVARRV